MNQSRRTLLRASALGITGGLAGCIGASESRQETETTPETTPAREPDETILLGGETSHWFGLAPESIHEAENPTLAMEPGTVYEVVWVNVDGVQHELRIFDADDTEVAATETVSAVGETASVVLEATEQLARYDCEYHPESMRGEVSQQATTATPSETTTEGGDGGYY